MHSKAKHIPIRYHYLREHVSQKYVKLEYIDTKTTDNKWEKFCYKNTKKRRLNLRGRNDDRGELLDRKVPFSLLSKGENV